MNKDEKLLSAVRKMQNGEEEGFNEVYSRTYNYVYFRARQIMKNEEDAQDLLQITYMEAFRSIKSLDSPESLFSWLGAITYRQGMKIFRKKTELLLDEEAEGFFEALESGDASLNPELSAEKREEQRILMSLIDELPETQRATIIAYYYDNIKIDDIAKIMECSVGTVKSRLNYARKFLKRRLTEESEKKGHHALLMGVTFPAVFYALQKMSEQTVLAASRAQLLYAGICKGVGLTAGTIGTMTAGGAAAAQAGSAAAGSAAGGTAAGGSAAGGSAAGGMATAGSASAGGTLGTSAGTAAAGGTLGTSAGGAALAGAGTGTAGAGVSGGIAAQILSTGGAAGIGTAGASGLGSIVTGSGAAIGGSAAAGGTAAGSLAAGGAAIGGSTVAGGAITGTAVAGAAAGGSAAAGGAAAVGGAVVAGGTAAKGVAIAVAVAVAGTGTAATAIHYSVSDSHTVSSDSVSDDFIDEDKVIFEDVPSEELSVPSEAADITPSEEPLPEIVIDEPSVSQNEVTPEKPVHIPEEPVEEHSKPEKLSDNKVTVSSNDTVSENTAENSLSSNEVRQRYRVRKKVAERLSTAVAAFLFINEKNSFRGLVDNGTLDTAYVIGKSSLLTDGDFSVSGNSAYIQSPVVSSAYTEGDKIYVEGTFILLRDNGSGIRYSASYDYTLTASELKKEQEFGKISAERLEISERTVLEGGVSHGVSDNGGHEKDTAADPGSGSADNEKKDKSPGNDTVSAEELPIEEPHTETIHTEKGSSEHGREQRGTESDQVEHKGTEKDTSDERTTEAPTETASESAE